MEREVVVTLRLAEGNTRSQFNQIKAALIDVRQEVTENNKALRENAKEQRALDAVLKAGGLTSEQYAVAQRILVEQRQELKLTSANLASAEAGLAAQFREAKNDVGGLTDAGLRFRDVLTQSTLAALKSEGVLGQLDAQAAALAAEQERLNTALRESKITQEQYDQAMSKTSTQLTIVHNKEAELRQEVDRLNQELREGKITVQQYNAEIAKLGTSTGAASLTFKDFFGNAKEGTSALTGLVNNYIGIGAAVYGASRALTDAVQTVADFDQQLANIRALGPEFVSNIDKISAAAIELGPALGVAPTEALKGFEALAKAGLSTEEILSGGLQSALTLSAAGEVEVGEAAETTATALVQFNLAGTEATKVADLLAKGANIAKGNASDFAAALNQSGLVASQFGLSIEETVGGLTAFAKAGLVGSDAGTSFRQALLHLQNPTDKARAELDAYGIELVDAGGNFLSLAQIAGQFQTKLSGLSEEQRNATLSTIFGSDAIRVANILYKQGETGIAEYTKTVQDSGFATEVATEKLNSAKGVVKQLSAEYDSFILSIESGEGAIGKAFGNLIKLATKALQLFQDISIATSGDAGAIANKLVSEIDKQIAPLKAKIEQLGKAGNEAALQAIKEQVKRDLETAIAQQQAGAGAAADEARVRATLALQAVTKAIGEVHIANIEATASAGASAAAMERQTKAATDETENLKVLKAELKSLKDSRTDANDNAAEIAAVQARITAIEGEKASRTSAAQQAKKDAQEVEGSVANLEKKIADLKAEQSTSTTSAQFDTYKAQIDGLNAQLDILTGKVTALPDLSEIQFGQLPGTPDSPAPAVNRDTIESLSTDESAAELARVELLNEQLLALDAEFLANKGLQENEYIVQKNALENELFGIDAQNIKNQAELDGHVTLIEALEIADAEYRAGVIKSEEELAERKAAINRAYTNTTAQQFANLFDNLSDLAQENSDEQKALAIVGALINTYLGVTQALANLPPPASYVAAAASLVAGLAAVAKITGFERGGFTPEASSNKKAVGVVHANEWVAPAHMVKNPETGKVIDWLENRRKGKRGKKGKMPKQLENAGFYTGGYTSPSTLYRSITPIERGLPGYAGGGYSSHYQAFGSIQRGLAVAETNAIMASKEFTAQIAVSEINDVQNRVAVQERMSTA